MDGGVDMHSWTKYIKLQVKGWGVSQRSHLELVVHVPGPVDGADEELRDGPPSRARREAVPQALFRRAHRLPGLARGARHGGRPGNAGRAAGAPPAVAGKSERLSILQASETRRSGRESLPQSNRDPMRVTHAGRPWKDADGANPGNANQCCDAVMTANGSSKVDRDSRYSNCLASS